MSLTHKQIKARGTKFQDEYSLSLKQIPGAWSTRLKDGYNADPFDFLTLLPWYDVACETKRCQDRFPFDQLEIHQIQGLADFQKIFPERRIGIVAINFKSLVDYPHPEAYNELYLFPIMDLVMYMLGAPVQYLPLEECRQGFGIPVRRQKFFDKRYGWALQEVLPYKGVGK